MSFRNNLIHFYPIASCFRVNFHKFIFQEDHFGIFARKMSCKSAILLLADGSEEMESVITADVLRRAGIDVTIASISGNIRVNCSRDVKICADTKLTDTIAAKSFDVVILPGGNKGSYAFVESKEVGELLRNQERSGKLIAAICAAPTALKAHGIGLGKRITSYPTKKEELARHYTYVDDNVVVDGQLITSKGPATTFAFALAIVSHLRGKDVALPLANGLLYE